MARQNIIRIKITAEVPYSRKEFGSATKAEKVVQDFQTALVELAKKHGISIPLFDPQHTSIDVEE